MYVCVYVYVDAQKGHEQQQDVQAVRSSNKHCSSLLTRNIQGLEALGRIAA